MRNYSKDGLAGDWVQPVNKWKVTIEMNVAAPTSDDAWEIVKEFIQNAMVNELELSDSDDEIIDDFDILDVEPAEIQM